MRKSMNSLRDFVTKYLQILIKEYKKLKKKKSKKKECYSK